jgi:hypothetical protein
MRTSLRHVGSFALAPLRRALAAGALASATLAGAAGAQAAGTAAVRGTVLSAEDGRPVALAMVGVPGTERTTFTAADGTFVLDSLAAGPTAVRVEQVGRVRADTTVAAPASGLVIRLAAQAIALEGIQVSASQGECTTGGFTQPSTAGQLVAVMEELRKNAVRQHLLVERFPYTARWARTRQVVDAGGAAQQSRADTLTVSMPAPPVVYARGAVLVNRGGNQYDLRMPNVGSLTQAEFQSAHCFRYGGVREVEGRRMYAVDFVPTRDVTTTDVTGTLYVDPADFVMRRAEFHVVALPAEIAYRGLDVVATFADVRPSMPLLSTLDFTQQLRNGRIQVEQRKLIGVQFTGADPGAR